MKALVLAAALACAASSFAKAADDASLTNDYPTSARADYVLGCMATNNQTRQALDNCSCSIDVIASILPYDKYVEAETVLSVRQGVGAQSRAFNATKAFNDMVANLRRAQAEAEIRCFH
jgi:lysyl-tRNA synthetase class II